MAKLAYVAALLVLIAAVAALMFTSGNSAVTTTSTYYTTTVPATTTALQASSGNVSFTSYSCTSWTDQYGNLFYNLSVSGTATGPEGTTLGVADNPGSGSYAILCGSWSNNGTFGGCYRGNGYPSTTSWSISDHFTGLVINQQALGKVYIDARETIFNNSDYTHIANSSVTVSCT